MSYFRITDGKGFHITFPNDWTVSVQFGPGNYCDNYERRIGADRIKSGMEGSTTAECAVWGNDGNLIEYDGWGDSVGARMTADQVLALFNWAASQ